MGRHKKPISERVTETSTWPPVDIPTPILNPEGSSNLPTPAELATVREQFQRVEPPPLQVVPKVSTPCWEYDQCWCRIEDVVNNATPSGSQGWEMFAVIPGAREMKLSDDSWGPMPGVWCFFKRMVWQ